MDDYYMKKRMGKRGFAFFLGVLLAGICLTFGKAQAQAAEGTIKTGIYAGDIDLSGMNSEQATQAINAYIDQLKAMPIVLIAGGGQQVPVTAGELGLYWKNTDLVTEALQVGIYGNVIERYKVMKDLEYNNKRYEIEIDFQMSSINDVLVKKGSACDQKAVNGSLTRSGGAFQMVAGKPGYHLDVESSIDLVYNYLTTEWNGKDGSIPLKVDVVEPEGSAEQLSQVKDVLGTFTTSFASSGSDRSANVTNGCKLINGTTLYPGEEFSTYKKVAPFTEANGYYMAGSYYNGEVVDSLGGGICQVSTTLYNAVLKAELEVTERHNHSMVVTYVDPSMDAAIAESSGKDFRFVNNTDAPIYIEGYVSNKKITFTIYGKETRSSSRQVSYESEILETIPSVDQVTEDASQPIGYIVTGGSAHTGYKARLWKVVKENGVEISRDQVNSSTYKMTSKTAVVGTATSDPNAYNEIIAAIGTQSISHVKEVIAMLAAAPPAAEPDPEPAPALETPPATGSATPETPPASGSTTAPETPPASESTATPPAQGDQGASDQAAGGEQAGG